MSELDDGDRVRYTLAQRKYWANSCPWIQQIWPGRQCEGWTPRKHACRNKAHWLYTFDVPPKNCDHDLLCPGQTHVFCWNHLSSRGVHGSMWDEQRWNELCEQEGFPEKLKEIFGGDE